MSLLISKLREILVFIFTLAFLLIFNLYFNLNYTWYGLSIIVRIYLLVFFSYLVFIFASVDINFQMAEYSKRFGSKGKILLFIETRALPFIFIFIITVLYTLIDYIRVPNWPWNPVLTLLNGRYSNNIIYAWLLLSILRLKIKPSISIVLFLSIAFAYFWIFEKAIYYVFESGTAASCIKMLKISVFLFFLINEFYPVVKGIIISLIIALILYISIVGIYAGIFLYSPIESFKSKESGYRILRMGYTFPVEKLKNVALKTYDYDLIRKLLYLEKQNEININYSTEEWKDLLFSGSISMADLVSRYISNKNIDLSYDDIIKYAAEKSEETKPEGSGGLEKASYFIKLSSRYYKGNEKDFLNRMKNANNSFRLWGIRLLKENKDINSMPILISFLTDIDERISENSYSALKKITDLDPAAALDKKVNDPDVLAIYNNFYLKYSNAQ